MRLAILFITSVVPCAHAQWLIQRSNTSASLRGIHNVGGGVAWASGSQGTVLRTLDGGQNWKRCTTPPNAEKLDFRGIQAFDDQSAIVMSSGPGDQSRVYRTTDGCRGWHLVFANPDAPDGFFDAIQFVPRNRRVGYLIGDPVLGYFALFRTDNEGRTWARSDKLHAENGEALFAASNSSLLITRDGPLIVTGGPVSRGRTLPDTRSDLPLLHGASAGAFAVAAHGRVLVAVGGDYKKPDESAGTCAVSTDGGLHWSVSKTPPHGYRSSVALDVPSKTWVAVGPNGTDTSTDNGVRWRPLPPSEGCADKSWNAISLPYAVGPNGRIGKLRAGALAQ